jgi:hypothetical protein
MSQDKSREKSLLFLLSTISRSLEASPENKVKIRELISTLNIEESEDKWIISVRLSNQLSKSIEIAKDRFSFYPVKSAARYEVNPAILNRNSAQEVLLFLFAEYDVQIPGKQTPSKSAPKIKFMPINLFFVSLFTIFSNYKIEALSGLFVLIHLVISTSKHHNSLIRRWILIASVVTPTIIFLALNDPSRQKFHLALSQLSLLLAFDILIRIETHRVSKYFIGIGRLAAALITFLNLVLAKGNLFSVTLSATIAILGYLIVELECRATLMNLLTLLHLGLSLLLVGALFLSTPLSLLLIPYLSFIAFHEILFGDNRNPSKIIYGVICLSA